MRTRGKKGVSEKYLKVLWDIKLQLSLNEQVNLQEVMSYNKASKSIPTILRKMGIIRYTLKGNEWVGNDPSRTLVTELREKIAERYANTKKQPAFEWAKPETTVRIEPKYEFTPQPDSSLVSEFIDHHEQSLLPSMPKRVKTAKNIEKTRMFQLRIFGLNLFTVKY